MRLNVSTELPGAFELIDLLRERGIVVSAGHTDATAAGGPPTNWLGSFGAYASDALLFVSGNGLSKMEAGAALLVVLLSAAIGGRYIGERGRGIKVGAVDDPSRCGVRRREGRARGNRTGENKTKCHFIY